MTILSNDFSKLQKGHLLTLKDRLSLRDCPSGISCEVKSVDCIKANHIDLKWRIFELRVMEGTDQGSELYLIVKEFDGDSVHRIYYRPTAVEFGDRQDFLNEGHDWLFKYDDESDLENVDNLSFTEEIWREGYDDPCYIRGGTMWGENNEGEFVGVTEWAIQDEDLYDKYDDPENILIETGDGGYMQFLIGCTVSGDDDEIECLSV